LMDFSSWRRERRRQRFVVVISVVSIMIVILNFVRHLGFRFRRGSRCRGAG
jgi:hypothetical protein